MEIKTVGVACDHAGYPLKQFVIQYLEEHKYAYKDFGCNSDLSCDYPDYAHPLAEAIESGEVYPGIAICGSGEGMAIALNKHQGVRAGLVWNKDVAELTRQHNDANVAVLMADLSIIRQQKRFSMRSSKQASRVADTSVVLRRFLFNRVNHSFV